jgi:tetratricopeptide (TPR) repeat protein
MVGGALMRYLFKHILMREAVYDMQLRRRLRELHRQAAEAIEKLHAADLAPHYADLAYHYEQSGIEEKAIEYLHKAGDYANETYDVQRAIDYYQKALDFLPESDDVMPRRILLHEGLSKVLRIQGRYPEAMAASQDMLAAASASGDEAARARAWTELSWTQNAQGDNHAALESAEQAEEIARRAQAQVELTNALILRGWALCRLGDLEEALSLGDQALEISTTLHNEPKMASALNLLSTAYDALGQYEQAMALTREALSIYRKLGQRLEEGVMLNNLGTTVGAFGDYSAASAIFREALDIAREIGDQYGEMLCLSNLGGMQVGLQDHRAAERNLLQALQIAEAIGVKFPEAYSFFSQACVGQGKIEEALTVARLGLSLAQETQEDVGGSWRALGMIAAHSPQPIAINGKVYDAAACFAESLRVFTEMGAEGQRARTLRSWARYEMGRGDKEQGEGMWQEARGIFEQLGMTLEVERMDADRRTRISTDEG